MQENISTNSARNQSETAVFAKFHPQYIQNGYSPLPIYYNSKVPCVFAWSDYCEKVIEDNLISTKLLEYPNAGMGLCNGYNNLLQVDVDVLDKGIQAELLTLNSFKNAIRRIGNPYKLGVFYFRWSGKSDFPWRKWLDKDRKVLVEVPCQCIAAPSLWTGIKGEIAPHPYVLMDASGNILEALPHISELPSFDEQDLKALEAVLKPYLYVPKVQHENYAPLNRDIKSHEVAAYEKYAIHALISQKQELSTIQKGNRHYSIYLSALKMGKFAHEYLLSFEDIVAAFESACNTNGYIPEHGRNACLIQIANGLRDGENASLPDLGQQQERKEKHPQKVELLMRCSADIEFEEIEWIIPGFIARKTITTFAGLPGVGKSQLAILMAATITSGKRWLEAFEKVAIGKVIYFQFEDSFESSIKPRFAVAGGDHQHLYAMEGDAKTEQGEIIDFDITRHMDSLSAYLEKYNSMDGPSIDLVIFDALSDFAGSGTDKNKENLMRPIYRQLKDLAKKHNIAILLIDHFNKASDVATIHKVGGSLTVTKVPRVVMGVFQDEDDSSIVNVLPMKTSNLGKKDSGYKFEMVNISLPANIHGIEKKIDTPLLQFRGYTDMKASDAIKTKEKRQSKYADAEEFVLDILKDGPVYKNDLDQRALVEGISPRLLKEVKEKHPEIVSKKDFDIPKAPWKWSIPQEGLQSRDAPTSVAETTKTGLSDFSNPVGDFTVFRRSVG